VVYLANKAEVIYQLSPISRVAHPPPATAAAALAGTWAVYFVAATRGISTIFFFRVCIPLCAANGSGPSRDSPRLIRGRNNFILQAVCLVGASFVDAAPSAICAFFAIRTVCRPHEIRRNLGYLSLGLNNLITKLIYSLNVSRALYQPHRTTEYVFLR